jgi:hypothetical protein
MGSKFGDTTSAIAEIIDVIRVDDTTSHSDFPLASFWPMNQEPAQRVSGSW